MIVWHGTDDLKAVEAFKKHTLTGCPASDLATLDGCEDWQDHFDADDQLVSVSQFKETALLYAEVALIELEIDEDELYQTNSEEHVFNTKSEYEVINIEFVDGSQFTMTRLPSGIH